MILPIDLVPGHPIENLGLVLSKHTPPLRGFEYSAFVRERLATASPGDFYAGAYRRWQRRTPPHPERRQVICLTAESPLLIGMGEPTPGENGLSHHHAYGVPHIPGSSLKGVARAWCARRFEAPHPWAVGGEAFSRLFGRSAEDDPDGGGEAGGVDFLDALPEPETARWVAEILTPHHADYYQAKGQVPPRGLEGPNPVTFLGAMGRFRLVVEGPPAWTRVAIQVLVAALSELGVGAKTRAGYGRLRPSVQALDGRDQAALDRVLDEEFPSFSFATQLEILQRTTNEAGLVQSLRAWILGRPPQLEKVALLEREPGRCKAVAAWLVEQGAVQGWRRRAERQGDEASGELIRFIEAWSGDQETPDDAPSGEEPETPSAPAYGDRGFTAPSLPTNEKKRARVLNRVSQQLAEGGYTAEAVAEGLAFLRAHGAKAGTLHQVRRAYGMEEEP
ncbi:MAG: type III-B CRISPR module RAMP protein Cmr6 [Alphaproteobacteria bacterium]|nr:type III-B CRISPR module RAMP protein Cmr6 [Alphaproteobacteria bacterium]